MIVVEHFEKFINGYLDRFVKSDGNIPERKRTYAKNVAGVALVAVFTVPFFAVLYSCIGLHIGALGIIGGGTGILLSPYIMRSARSIILARTMILTSLYCIFLIICISTKGIESACTYWFLSIPVAGIFMGGIIPGIFWSFIVTITIMLMHFYEAGGGLFINQTTDHGLLLQSSSIIGLIAVVTSLTMIFESSKNQSYSKVKTAKNRLEKTTGELSILIKMISSSIVNTKKETGIISDKAEIMAKAMSRQESILESAALTMKDIAKHTLNNSENAGVAKKEAVNAGELSVECEEILRQLLQKWIEVSDYSDHVIDCLCSEKNKTDSGILYKTGICLDTITDEIARINIVSGQGKTEALNAKPALTELLSSSRKVARLASQVYLNSQQQAMSNEIAASNIGSIKDSAKEISVSSIEIADSVKKLDESVKHLETFLSSIEERSA